MTFAKLISRTADSGLARYALPAPGLLNPETKYFWHVRARDAKGVWGPWSPAWSFTPAAPSSPQEVHLEFDHDRNRGVLRWKPGSLGRKPVKYRIYSSDEKGFSASDAPYKVTVGISTGMPSAFPANFLTETSARELEVVGPRGKTPGCKQGLLPRGRRRRSRKPERPLRLCRFPTPRLFQRADHPGSERGCLSISARRDSITR